MALVLTALPATSRAGDVSVVMELGGVMKMTPVLIADLPECEKATRGTVAMVSDAVVPSYRATVIGGGTEMTLVLCDGVTWKSD